MQNFKGWILDALPREAAKALERKIDITFIPVKRRNLVSVRRIRNFYFPYIAEKNLFIHHRSFLYVESKRNLEFSINRIWLTHFDQPCELDLLVSRSMYIDKLFVQNSRLFESLVASGFESNKISIQPGAVNRTLFFPSKSNTNGRGYFLFTGDCKERKSPEFIEWLIQSFPSTKFRIHGNGWKTFNGGSLLRLRNLEIFDFNYIDQGEMLRNAYGLLILSTLEGGPISLLESLACGTPVVATNVGFAVDILNSGTGLIITLEKSTDYWLSVFESVVRLKFVNGCKDLLNGRYTWEELGNEFYS
jgi:glycosyltransferase involved in cell wall biosynthesis